MKACLKCEIFVWEVSSPYQDELHTYKVVEKIFISSEDRLIWHEDSICIVRTADNLCFYPNCRVFFCFRLSIFHLIVGLIKHKDRKRLYISLGKTRDSIPEQVKWLEYSKIEQTWTCGLEVIIHYPWMQQKLLNLRTSETICHAWHMRPQLWIEWKWNLLRTLSFSLEL